MKKGVKTGEVSLDVRSKINSNAMQLAAARTGTILTISLCGIATDRLGSHDMTSYRPNQPTCTKLQSVYASIQHASIEYLVLKRSLHNRRPHHCNRYERP
jgi:hypothetical protein